MGWKKLRGNLVNQNQMRPQAPSKTKLVNSETFQHVYLSNLPWTLAYILRVFCVMCGFRWPLKTTCDILCHRMVPFSICCHAIVLFTSSCQMSVIMNAFIANVIKPNITCIQDEADSTGEYIVPTKTLEMGLSCLHQETMHWKVSYVLVHKCLILPTQNKPLGCSCRIAQSISHRELFDCSE